ncbi:phosphatidylinositol-glycan-specific phospholipase D-like isoform X2 [Babylonia areolata]|uniref:phosphatidylinositol-glycan-specific phospholipase D-like isoform X2 n=1 Tax=Babylonia areolata TaxID=304850 RepID=UPI003FCEEB47
MGPGDREVGGVFVGGGVPPNSRHLLARTGHRPGLSGCYGSSHSVGDIGGDIMTLFEFNVTHMPYLTEWYIPVDDLHNIYTELYGAALMPRDVIVACTLELYAERLGEKLAIDKLYPDYAEKSPFLVDQLTDYFLGGLDDMAVWTQNVWRKAVLMLEEGTGACHLDHNPLYIGCQGQTDRPHKRSRGGRRPERNGFYSPRRFTQVGREDVVVRKSLRGVTLQPDTQLQEALLLKQKERAATFMKKKVNSKRGRLESNEKAPDAVYSVSNSYAKLGWSMAAGDLDGDGNDDVVIGAPGYRYNGSPQEGAVFVLFGSDKGLPLSDLNLDESADIVLHSTHLVNGRLGSSVAIVDINQDGIADIATGAPSTGSSRLSYEGTVEVFYGTGQRKFAHNMTVTCQDHYCNLGRSLAEGDIDGDSFPDLLIGSPFSGGKGDQRGAVVAVVSSKTYRGRFVQLDVSILPWRFPGSQNYSWFGESVSVVTNAQHTATTFVLVTEPAWRSCAWQNCSFTDKDVQEVGQLNVFTASSPGKPVSPSWRITGTQGLQKFGSSAAVGRPLSDGTPVLAVGAPGQNVAGTIADIHVTFPQTGAVWLYNLSDPHWAPAATLQGDRRFSRFGSQILFSDVNSDGFDDLIVGAPFRTDDVTEEVHAGEEGAAYVYYGGSAFPWGGNATSSCPRFSVITPCPADVASVVLAFGEDKARLGGQFAVVRSKTKVDILVTALHSSRGARLSGAVALYSFLKT